MQKICRYTKESVPWWCGFAMLTALCSFDKSRSCRTTKSGSFYI